MPKTNAERQRAYYERHKEERRREREMLGFSTYNEYHQRYYDRLKARRKNNNSNQVKNSAEENK